MQKPKNLLPGLFLCVFSRIAEPLVDFYCSNLLAFPPFLFGADFFAGKKGIAGPFYIGPFYTGPFCAPIPQKTPPRLYSAALFGMPPRPHKRAPHKKAREPVAPLNAHLEIPIQKARRARRAFTNMRLYLARTAPKGPTLASPQPLKTTLSGPCTANLASFTHTKIPMQKPRE